MLSVGRVFARPAPAVSLQWPAGLFLFFREVAVLPPGRVSARRPPSFFAGAKKEAKKAPKTKRSSGRPDAQSSRTLSLTTLAFLIPRTEVPCPYISSVCRDSDHCNAPGRDDLHWRMGNSTSVRGIKNARAVSDSVLPNSSSGRPDERLIFRCFLCLLSLHQQRK